MRNLRRQAQMAEDASHDVWLLDRGEQAKRQTGKMPTEGQGFDAMLEHAANAWMPPGSRVRTTHRVFARDGWRCTAPGCSSFQNLHDHHIVFRSAGGGDELGNRTTLCA